MISNSISACQRWSIADEKCLEVADRQQILADWQHFMTGGFKQGCSTERHYEFLCHSCAFIARRDRSTFWTAYFSAESIRLRMFLNQFGGSGRSVDCNDRRRYDLSGARLPSARLSRT